MFKHFFFISLLLLLIVILLSENLYSTSNAQQAKLTYDIIPENQWMQLKAIRDSIGSITGLDTLYEDRTHPNGLPYHIYIPKNLTPDTVYPLVIFLHGYTDLTLGTHNGFPKGVWSLPMFQDKHPHILFLPRHRTINDFWPSDSYRNMVMEALDDLISELSNTKEKPNIDTTRIYLTGFSQGGMGTWNYIMTFPHKFAAAAPLSGFYYGPQNITEAEEIMHIPIWIFNGDGDDGVGGSRISYEMLAAAGAPDVLYHEYENHGHVIDDFAYFTEDFLDWFFAQRLNITSIHDESRIYPTEFALYQNYPNPFNPSTKIRFDVPVITNVKMMLYNILGEKVQTLVNKKYAPGRYEYVLDASKLAAGIYFYQIKTDQFMKTKRMILIK